jgi:hypothetical protein
MTPDAPEILRRIRGVLLSTVTPEVQTPAVRAQVGYAAGLLDLLAQEWDEEAERLETEITDLRRSLGRLASALPLGREGVPELARESPATSGAAETTGRSAQLREDLRLRASLVETVQAAGAADPALLPSDVRAELNALLRRTAERRRGLSQ